MRKASGTYRGAPPKRLSDRLALLESGVVPVRAPKPHPRVRDAGPKPKRRLAAASFALGAGCGAALGCVALMVLLAYPEAARIRNAIALPDAASWLPHVQIHAREDAGGRAKPVRAPTFEVTAIRDEAGNAPLPLRVVGVDGSADWEVILRDLPSAVRFSGGARQDEHTWTLRPADLPDLNILSGEGMPATFDMTIGVASAGVQIAETLARVHLSERPPTAAASVPPVAPSIGTPFRTEITALPPSAAPTRLIPLRPPLPEGISTLGGPMGEPGAATPPQSRTVWWTLPPQAWSPFADRGSGN